MYEGRTAATQSARLLRRRPCGRCGLLRDLGAWQFLSPDRQRPAASVRCPRSPSAGVFRPAGESPETDGGCTQAPIDRSSGQTTPADCHTWAAGRDTLTALLSRPRLHRYNLKPRVLFGCSERLRPASMQRGLRAIVSSATGQSLRRSNPRHKSKSGPARGPIRQTVAYRRSEGKLEGATNRSSHWKRPFRKPAAGGQCSYPSSGDRATTSQGSRGKARVPVEVVVIVARNAELISGSHHPSDSRSRR